MQNLTGKTIREIALEFPATTKVFEKFKIDYCCGGKKLFFDSCGSVGADPDIVLNEIELVLHDPESRQLSWTNDSKLSVLIDYILEKHHTFANYELEHLPPLVDKVTRVHGEYHPVLFDVKRLFEALCEDLSHHFRKEEIVLFPYIRELEDARLRGNPAPTAPFGTIENPVTIMVSDHERAAEILREMRKITDDYLLPAGACPSFTGMYYRFVELERDLHQHIHLENNLLFPKAVSLEKDYVQHV